MLVLLNDFRIGLSCSRQYRQPRVRRDGEGSPLLVIVGTSADRGLWSQVRGTLAGQFRTIAVDIRDFGQSSLATEPQEANKILFARSDIFEAQVERTAPTAGFGMRAAGMKGIVHSKDGYRNKVLMCGGFDPRAGSYRDGYDDKRTERDYLAVPGLAE